MGYPLYRCIFVWITRAKEMKEDRCCCDRRSALRLWPPPASLAGTTAWICNDALSSQGFDKRTHVALCRRRRSGRKSWASFGPAPNNDSILRDGYQRVPPSRRMPRIPLGLRATTRLAWELRWNGVDVSALAMDFIHYTRTYQGQQRTTLSCPGPQLHNLPRPHSPALSQDGGHIGPPAHSIHGHRTRAVALRLVSLMRVNVLLG
jgi:hypothetical protein